MALTKITLVCLLALLAGCATAPEQIKVEEFSVTENPSFTLVDARPMENIRGGFHENSYSMWWVYGDDRISPPPLVVMRSGLARNLGSQFAGKTIKVEKFEVSVTRLKAGAPIGAGYSSSGSVVLGQLLAGVLINVIEGSKNGPTIATEIVIDIEGKKIEHAERDFQVSGELGRRLADNMVKAVGGAASKITELFNPKVTQEQVKGETSP